MNWKTQIEEAFDYQYAVADKMMDLVGDEELGWKPATGDNWMNVGQLLLHISSACGAICKCFVTGQWGMSPDEKLPSAENMQSVANVAEAKQLLAEDKKLAFEMLAECREERLDSEKAPAPWDEMETVLGERMLEMAMHLNQHKGQLFYYLKLQGKPVNTMQLWGV